MAVYNEKGQEVPDPTPVALPVGYSAPESMQSMIARMCRVEFSKIAQQHGLESFEEADDFDVDEDEKLETEYQLSTMQEEAPRVRDKQDVDRGKVAAEGGRTGPQPSVERVDQSASVSSVDKGSRDAGPGVSAKAYTGPERRGKAQ